MHNLSHADAPDCRSPVGASDSTSQALRQVAELWAIMQLTHPSEKPDFFRIYGCQFFGPENISKLGTKKKMSQNELSNVWLMGVALSTSAELLR